MATPDRQLQALEAVAVLTMASGAMQVVAPGVVLDRLASQPDRLSRHLFATVGMFMIVSGGSTFAALRAAPGQRRVPLGWCVAQKLGAAAAVTIGVRRKILSPAALPVAGFDAASALMALAYRRQLPA